MNTTSFEGLAGLCAILAGLGGLLYSLSFLVLKDATLLIALFLMLGGILTTAVMTGLYQRLREVDAAFALWGFVLGVTGALGAAIHGAYDLANAINPPKADVLAANNLPSQLDPRGLMTFGVAGLGVFVLAWLMGRSRAFPMGLSYVGMLLGVLSVVIYLVRLIILDPSASPLIPIALGLTGFLVNPAWYIWLGLTLLRAPAPAAAPVQANAA
jgi:hypothetical protein